MAGQTTTATISDSFQRYLSRDLLDRMNPTLVFAGHAMKNPLPAQEGAKTMRMFRFAAPSRADVQTLTEGTVPASSTHKQLTLEYVDVDLVQYGQSISITDQLSATALFQMAEQANTQNSEDAALHCDALTMFELTTSTGTVGNVNYANKNFVYANGAANYAAVYNSGTKASTLIMTAADILDAATYLKVKKAPRINGSFVLAVGPQTTRDLMAGANSNTTWADVSKYSAAQQLFNGEIGKLYGVRVVEHTEPYRSAATAPGAAPATNYSSTGVVFSAHMFGRNAYGVSDLATIGSPKSPKVLVVTGADKSDPLNQVSAIVSWKTYWAAKVIQPYWVTHIYTQSGSAA